MKTSTVFFPLYDTHTDMRVCAGRGVEELRTYGQMAVMDSLTAPGCFLWASDQFLSSQQRQRMADPPWTLSLEPPGHAHSGRVSEGSRKVLLTLFSLLPAGLKSLWLYCYHVFCVWYMDWWYLVLKGLGLLFTCTVGKIGLLGPIICCLCMYDFALLIFDCVSLSSYVFSHVCFLCTLGFLMLLMTSRLIKKKIDCLGSMYICSRGFSHWESSLIWISGWFLFLLWVC